MKKYRIWNCDKQAFVSGKNGSLVIDLISDLLIKCRLKDGLEYLSEEVDDTQYKYDTVLGIRDKNNRPIYQSDIIEFKDETLLNGADEESAVTTINRAVVKSNELYGVYLEQFKYDNSEVAKDNCLVMIDKKTFLQDCEVVGNIHENAQFLN